MGIFSKARDVRSTNINEMLAKAEDPLRLVRLIISEMEDALVEARSTAVRTLAQRRELERHIAELQAQAADWEQKAELALRKSREDLARGALALRARVLAQRTELERGLPELEAQVQKLDADIGELRAKLAEARQRQRMLSVRGDTSSSRRRVREQLTEVKSGRQEAAFQAATGAVERMESEVDALSMGDSVLAAEFAKLETDDQINDELVRLRRRIAGDRGDASEPNNN